MREKCEDCISYRKCKAELAESGIVLYGGAVACVLYQAAERR